MEFRETYETDVDGAREEIFFWIQRFKGKNVIYFDGWGGLGAAPVIRSVAQVLRSIKAQKTPPDLSYDRIIYIDCSAWISERVMQRKIAEELELDKETIGMFDKQDEEDDYNGVDHRSRDVIRRVSQMIAQTLSSSRFIMVFLNGSDHEVDVLSKFGIRPNYHDHVVLWTFKRRLLTMHQECARPALADKLRYTHLFLGNYGNNSRLLKTTEFITLLRKEVDLMVARNPCIQDIDPTVITDSCLYCLFLHYCFLGTNKDSWAARAPDFCLYDGIIKKYITREIHEALHMEINWDCDASKLEKEITNFMQDPDAPFLIVKDNIVYQRRPYRWIWISITSENLKVWSDMQTILATASSLFVAFDNFVGQQMLPIKLFEQCNNLQVLILSNCTFSFLSPPFLKCHKLKFLGVDHCNDNKIIKEEVSPTEWTFLHNLWVLDIHYTHWDRIISLDKMDLMANLHELNIEGFVCWQYTSKLQGRLPNLQRLRIVKPTQQAETLEDNRSNSSIDKTKLEILDLSGNRDMKNLPAGISNACNLQMLIIDGCDGLEDVVSDGLPSSLRSFSFDGYGPASHWTSLVKLPPKGSRPKSVSEQDKKDTVKISKISLQGCKHLENLFVRGLSNLEELDLSGSPIKILDFETMVVDVSRLRRIILLGCQKLRAIRWGSFNLKGFELVCVDTRPSKAPGFTRPPLPHKHFGLQLHAILADARLVRSLWQLVNKNVAEEGDDTYFNIHITSSTENSGFIQLEAIDKVVVELTNERHHAPACQYDDILTESIGNTLLMAFPHPPTQQLDRHIKISDASLALESELELSDNYNLADMMRCYAESLHVHDVRTKSSMPDGNWFCLRWCHVERCPSLETIFPPDAVDCGNQLEIIWASDLPMARSIWSKGSRQVSSFKNLEHLYLRSCPRLQYGLPIWISFPSLKTIYIIRCGDLRHIFVHDETYPDEIAPIQDVLFPKLTTIYLYDLPKLLDICEVKMLAPALETIKIRGCWSMCRLPALEGREPGMKKPAVEVEKDVWDTLQWDGPAAGHHPDLYKAPVHSRHYRRRRLLRGTVLR